MSIRLKLFLTILIPLFMLSLSGAFTSFKMRSLGRQVADMLRENERSIHYAVVMNEALERMDNAVLLLMSGDSASFRAILADSNPALNRALEQARENVTIVGEGELLDSVRNLCDAYLTLLEDSSGAISLPVYHDRLSPLLRETQKKVSDLRLLNTEAMYGTSRHIADQAKRAALPGDLLIFSAVIFAALFLWLVQLNVVTPLILLNRAIQEWERSGTFDAPVVTTKDELQSMALSLTRIVNRTAKRAM